MKSYKENIQEVLTGFIKGLAESENYYGDIAKVVSVDDSERTCTCEVIDGPTIEDVRLQQVSSENGIYIKPSIDSIVILGYTDKTTAYVAMFSQIDSIVFQGGSNLGIPKTPETVSQLNKIEQDINDLKQVFSTWAPIPTDGGASLKAAAAVWYGSSLVETVNDDIQNENFLQ